MNIDCKLKDKSGHILVVQYDDEAQSAFVKAHAAAEELWRDPQIQHVCGAYGQIFLARIRSGLDLLRHFAQNKALAVEIPDHDLQIVLEATVIVSEAGIVIERNVSAFSNVIVLLAKVTALVVPLFPLPPVAEVFDRDQVSKEVWEGFERIRYRSGAEPPRLVFLHLYQLWFELFRIRPTNGELRCLLQYLDQVTGVFRGVMASHAASTIALAKPTKKSRQRRKS